MISLPITFQIEESLLTPAILFLFQPDHRLSWGGAQASDHLLRLFQLKYPTFPLRLTPTQATNLLETQTFCSNSYFKDLSDCSNSLAGSERLGIEGIDRIIQFPIPISDRNLKTEEELKLQEEKRKESGRRLREQQAKARFEKIMEKERNLEIYTALKEEKKGEKKGDWQVSRRDLFPFLLIKQV